MERTHQELLERFLAGKTTEEENIICEKILSENPSLESFGIEATDGLLQALKEKSEYSFPTNTEPHSTLKSQRDQDSLAHIISFLDKPDIPTDLGRIDRYRVLELIGSGGMGFVFRCIDARLQRRVSLKILRPELAFSRESINRFEREASEVAKLSSDYIVAIFDVGFQNNLPWFVMPHLEGCSLREFIRRETKVVNKPHQNDSRFEESLAWSLEILRQVAEGLCHAHKRGLLHRDIKPENIWVGENGNVKLLDFGLARQIDDTSTMTQYGMLIGTPRYMAPEQIIGKPIDARSDLFSLGLVFVELLTGKPMFEESNIITTLVKLANDEIRVSEVVLDLRVPTGVVTLAQAMLENDREKRIGSAEKLVELVRLEQEKWSTRKKTPRRQRTPKAKWMASCAVLFLGILLSSYLANQFWNSIQSRNTATNSKLAEGETGESINQTVSKENQTAVARADFANVLFKLPTVALTQDSKTQDPEIQANAIQESLKQNSEPRILKIASDNFNDEPFVKIAVNSDGSFRAAMIGKSIVSITRTDGKERFLIPLTGTGVGMAFDSKFPSLLATIVEASPNDVVGSKKEPPSQEYDVTIWRLHEKHGEPIGFFTADIPVVGWDQGFQIAYCQDKMVKTYRLDTRETQTQDIGAANVSKLTFSPNGKRLAISESTKHSSQVSIWDFTAKKYVYSQQRVYDVWWSADSNKVALCSLGEGKVYFLRSSDFHVDREYKFPLFGKTEQGSDHFVDSVTVDPQFQYLAWVFSKNQLQVRNLETNREMNLAFNRRLYDLHVMHFTSGTRCVFADQHQYCSVEIAKSGGGESLEIHEQALLRSSGQGFASLYLPSGKNTLSVVWNQSSGDTSTKLTTKLNEDSMKVEPVSTAEIEISGYSRTPTGRIDASMVRAICFPRRGSTAVISPSGESEFFGEATSKAGEVQLKLRSREKREQRSIDLGPRHLLCSSSSRQFDVDGAVAWSRDGSLFSTLFLDSESNGTAGRSLRVIDTETFQEMNLREFETISYLENEEFSVEQLLAPSNKYIRAFPFDTDQFVYVLSTAVVRLVPSEGKAYVYPGGKDLLELSLVHEVDRELLFFSGIKQENRQSPGAMRFRNGSFRKGSFKNDKFELGKEISFQNVATLFDESDIAFSHDGRFIAIVFPAMGTLAGTTGELVKDRVEVYRWEDLENDVRKPIFQLESQTPLNLDQKHFVWHSHRNVLFVESEKSKSTFVNCDTLVERHHDQVFSSGLLAIPEGWSDSAYRKILFYDDFGEFTGRIQFSSDDEIGIPQKFHWIGEDGSVLKGEGGENLLVSYEKDGQYLTEKLSSFRAMFPTTRVPIREHLLKSPTLTTSEERAANGVPSQQ